MVCHGSTPAELEAVKAKMTSALSQASFSLHPWINYSTPPEDFTLPKWPKSYLDKLIPDEIGYQYCAHCLGGLNDENIYSKNLGLKVCTICDYATLTCNVNLSAKKRGRYEKPCLKKGENIEEYVKNVGKLSKRIFARFVASLWDLTGYYGPIVLIARLAFRQAIMTEEKALGWDDNLSDSAQQLLINALTRIYEGHGSSMARNLVPRKGYVKNEASPLLCICVDSGQAASAAVAFLCTEFTEEDKQLTGNFYHVRNFRSVIRLHSLNGHSLPQGESLALTLGVRLRETIAYELEDFIKVNKVVYLSDSASCIYQMGTRHNLLETFFSNRNREFNSKANYADLYYVDTTLQPADLISKTFDNKTMQQIMNNPLWTGKSYMQKPFSSWPVRHLEPKKTTNGIVGVMPKYHGFDNNVFPNKITGFLQINIDSEPLMTPVAHSAPKPVMTPARHSVPGNEELIFINKLGVVGAISHKRQFVEKALVKSAQIIPYFLTEKGIKENDQKPVSYTHLTLPTTPYV